MVTPDPPPPPIVRIGEACRAWSVSMTVEIDNKDYRISTIELCGKKILLKGRLIRVHSRR